MKRFITKIIIVMMLLSIGYYLRGIVNDNAEIKEAIVIHGSNDKWEIKDLKVIKYKQRVQWGGGRATYLGDPVDLDNLKSFQLEIVKEHIEGKGRTETLYLKSTSSNQGFSIGEEKAFATIGGIDSNKIRYINMEHHESNISAKSNYNFDESHRVRVNVYLKYLNGEKVEDEFYLDTIAMNKETFEKIHMYSEAK